MSHKNSDVCSISLAVILFFGVLFGVISSALWFFGYIDFIRPMVPYSILFGFIVLTVTAVIDVKCNDNGEHEKDAGNYECEPGCGCHAGRICSCVKKYTKLIIISGGLVLIIGMTVIAVHIGLIAGYVIGLVGAAGFWVLLFSFLSMLYCFFTEKRR